MDAEFGLHAAILSALALRVRLPGANPSLAESIVDDAHFLAPRGNHFTDLQQSFCKEPIVAVLRPHSIPNHGVHPSFFYHQGLCIALDFKVFMGRRPVSLGRKFHDVPVVPHVHHTTLLDTEIVLPFCVRNSCHFFTT